MNMIRSLMRRDCTRCCLVAVCAVGLTVSASSVHAQTGSVASPSGTTYSVTHQLGRDPDGNGPEPTVCIPPVTLPTGEPDDIVTFDGVPEFIRTDVLNTEPLIDEFKSVDGSSSYTVTIVSSASTGQDLFPAIYNDGHGNPLTDGCFTIGLDDQLDWIGIDNVVLAALVAKRDGITIVGPLDVTAAFSSPWSGFANVVLPGIAGRRANRIELQFIVSKDVETPPNDRCADAPYLSTGNTRFSNVGADTDGFVEPLDCDEAGSDQIGSDIWYKLSAPCSGALTVDVCNSGFDTRMAVYGGCGVCPPASRPLACNDDTSQCGTHGQASRIQIPTRAGDCLTVRIGGYLADQGTGTISVVCRTGACCQSGVCLNNENEPSCLAAGGLWFPDRNCAGFTCPPPPPDHDECVDCIAVTAGVPYQGSSVGATGAAGDSSCSATDNADVWHCWTADCDGYVTAGLCDSPFDTTLAVFDGCGGAELACSDDACQNDDARVTFKAVSGTAYAFRVAGSAGATGAYTLNVSTCSDPSGACCNAGPFRCAPTTDSRCAELSGTWVAPGTVCLGDLNGNNVDDACEACSEPATLTSDPPNCAIDARYPHNPSDSQIRFGWDRIELLLDCEPSVLAPDDVTVTVEPSGGTAPTITSVDLSGKTAVLWLDAPIPTNAWTCFELIAGGSKTCVGSLPGDVNGDRASVPADVLDLIDDLNGVLVPPLSIWQCDTDRSGVCQAADILGVIDLLNGADAFDPWLNAGLPIPCPAAP